MKFKVSVSFGMTEWEGPGGSYGEALANLYNVFRTGLGDEWQADSQGFLEAQLEQLAMIEVPWGGEVHPLPDVHRFLLEEARIMAGMLGELRAEGMGPLDATHTVERERGRIRRKAMANVLERDMKSSEGGDHD